MFTFSELYSKVNAMQKDTEQEILQTCQAHLRALQPVKKVEGGRAKVGRRDYEPDFAFVLHTEVGPLRYIGEVKRGLSLPRLEHLLLQLQPRTRKPKFRTLLLTDYLPPRLAERLVAAGVNFVDEAGNVYIHYPGKLYIRVQGARLKHLREATAGRLSQPSGLQVVFTLFTEPRAASMSYRELAKVSGVALGSVARIVQELKEKGHFEQKNRDEWLLTRKRELLDFWVGGYGERLRPKLVVGRFQPPEEDLSRTLARLKKEVEAKRIAWALTGGFAADLLIRHFRGNQLGFFVEEWSANLANSLKWLPSPHGPVTVLRQFSPLVVLTPKHPVEAAVAHPLLVYAELVFQRRERELEAAKLLYDRYLVPLVHGD